MDVNLTDGVRALQDHWGQLDSQQVVRELKSLYENKQLTSNYRTQEDRNGRMMNVRRSGADLILNDVCPTLSSDKRMAVLKELVRLTPMAGVKLNSSLGGQPYTPWQKFMMWAPGEEIGAALSEFNVHYTNYPHGKFNLTAAMILGHRGEEIVSKVEEYMSLKFTGVDRGGKTFLDHYITSSDISLDRVKAEILSDDFTPTQWDRVLLNACKNASVDVETLAKLASIEAPVSESVPARHRDLLRTEDIAVMMETDPVSAPTVIYNLYKRGIVSEPAILSQSEQSIETIVNGMHKCALQNKDLATLNKFYDPTSERTGKNIYPEERRLWLVPRGDEGRGLVQQSVDLSISQHYIASNQMEEATSEPTAESLEENIGINSDQIKLLSSISRNAKSKELLNSTKEGDPVVYHEFCDSDLTGTQKHLVTEMVRLRDHINSMSEAVRYDAQKETVAMLAGSLVELGMPIDDMSYSRDFIVDDSNGKALTNPVRKYLTKEVNFGRLANEYFSRPQKFKASNFTYAKMYEKLSPDEKNRIISDEVISSVNLKKMVDKSHKTYWNTAKAIIGSIVGAVSIDVGFAGITGGAATAVAAAAILKFSFDSYVKQDAGALDVIHGLKGDYRESFISKIVASGKDFVSDTVVDAHQLLDDMKDKTVEQLIDDMSNVSEIALTAEEKVAEVVQPSRRSSLSPGFGM